MLFAPFVLPIPLEIECGRRKHAEMLWFFVTGFGLDIWENLEPHIVDGRRMMFLIFPIFRGVFPTREGGVHDFA